MREGYKVTELGEIPEGWESIKLSQVGKIISGGTPDTKSSLNWNGGIPWCTPTDITSLKGKKYILKTNKTISDLGLKNSSATMLPKDSVIVCTRATIGDCAINKLPITTNQGFKSIVTNENFNTEYLYYLINNIKDKIIKLSSGSTFLEISKKAFENIDFLAPPLPEQQKIASILSTVDEKIDNIDAQISQTYELKKGLMQQLLTKGIGHTKFKSSELGDIPESWGVAKIKNISNVNETSLPNSTKPEYEFKYLDLSAVKIGCVKLPQEKIRFSSAPSRARRIIKKDDVIMATVRPNLLGNCYVDFDVNDVICSTGFCVITPNSNNNGMFIYQFLYSQVMQSQINKLIVGSNYPAINSSDVENLKIVNPPLPEQQKIATILSIVDEKITSLQTKKQTYQQLKKGLMQQLLTGKIRVQTSQTEPSLA